LNAVARVLNQLATYSRRANGRSRPTNTAADILNLRPEGCQAEQKHLWIAFRGGVPIGLVDLIEGYPRPGVGFVGLLAIVEPLHGHGAGRAVFAELIRRARRLKLKRLRLAVVGTNPVQGFWGKMGFRRTGETRARWGERKRRTLFLMERRLG
jgi:GNAT superfamily N-acetyltransferase